MLIAWLVRLAAVAATEQSHMFELGELETRGQGMG